VHYCNINYFYAVSLFPEIEHCIGQCYSSLVHKQPTRAIRIHRYFPSYRFVLFSHVVAERSIDSAVSYLILIAVECCYLAYF